MPPLTRFKRFDVRDLIRRGLEPFQEIRRRVDALGQGEGLFVIAPFLPSPLVERFSGKGFATKVERGRGPAFLHPANALNDERISGQKGNLLDCLFLA